MSADKKAKAKAKRAEPPAPKGDYHKDLDFCDGECVISLNSDPWDSPAHGVPSPELFVSFSGTERGVLLNAEQVDELIAALQKARAKL